MNKEILHKEIQEFISVNLRVDVSKILFKKQIFSKLENRELAEQIVSKLKSQTKLPSWFAAQNILYPPKLSIEQTSSERTANYKSEIVSGNKLVDLTGGFGVDCFYFSKKIKKVVHCEINKNLSQLAAHNLKELGVKNCQFVTGDGLEFLETVEGKLDWVFVDPSRRDNLKGKVFLMKDCLPDVPKNLSLLLSKTHSILMKTSPLVDITQGIKELEFVKEIHVVAVQNEVKELLWVIEKDWNKKIEFKTINLLKNKNQKFTFNSEVMGNKDVNYSLPQSFLYEPNAAILKSGGFSQVAIHYKVNKLHPHSHLYTSKEQIDFPGRVFNIKEVLPFNNKQLNRKLGGVKANVSTRNFPVKVEELKKLFKIKDGGEVYLFFTTNLEQKKIVIIGEKV